MEIGSTARNFLDLVKDESDFHKNNDNINANQGEFKVHIVHKFNRIC